MRYSVLFLRIGLGAVFLLFGFDKIVNLGGSIGVVANLGFISADLSILKIFVMSLGILEILMALSFFFGFLTRLAAFGASVFFVLILISFKVKFGFLEYRDIGLLGMSLYFLFNGAEEFSVDRLIFKKKV